MRHRFGKSIVKLSIFSLSLLNFATAAVAENGQRVLGIVQTEAGLVLADAKDLSLYTFDQDEQGVSNCYNSCAAVWPPVLTDLVEVAAPFGRTERTDGRFQITYKGQPLYLYAPDKKPGDIKGEGVGGVWHLARIQD